LKRFEPSPSTGLRTGSAIERLERFESNHCRSEAIAVGSLSFVNGAKRELGFKVAHREVARWKGAVRLVKKAKLTGLILGVKVRL